MKLKKVRQKVIPSELKNFEIFKKMLSEKIDSFAEELVDNDMIEYISTEITDYNNPKYLWRDAMVDYIGDITDYLSKKVKELS